MNIISIHIFPHELSEYKRIIDDLNISLHRIEPDQVEIRACLNLNSSLIDYTDPSDYENTKTRFTEINRGSTIICKESIKD